MPCPHCKEKINICTSCAYSQEDEFVRCPQCNKIVEYCAHCGTKLYVVPNKENEREFDKAFSRVFGYNVNFDTKICPKCGQEIGDVLFCPFCGNDLTDFGQGKIIDNDYEVVDNIYNYLDDPQYQYNPDIVTEFFTNPLRIILKSLFGMHIEKPERAYIDESLKEKNGTNTTDDNITKTPEKEQTRDFNTLDKKSSGGALWFTLVLLIIAFYILYKTFFAG